MSDEYILEMQDITKIFPGVKALDQVSLKVKPAVVHALLGENGAGKSTLMKILNGIYQQTEGTILYKGKKVRFANTLESIKKGISMIHQELSPVPHRSVMENIWLGREPLKKLTPFVDHKKMYQNTEKLLAKIGIKINPKEEMANLTVAKIQMVEIAKAISYNSEIVIMDEPTSSLTEVEVKQLFRIIGTLKEQGKAIIYISHKMEDIFQISDEITILRDGQYIGSYNTVDMTTDKLIKEMVGRELSEMFPKVECNIGDVKLKAENLSSKGLFKNVSFELRKGEILGFAGLIGAGRTEVMETIFGVRSKSSGKIYIDGKETRINTPEDAIKQKIAMLTEDRRKSGIIEMLDIKDNTSIANIDSYTNVLGYFLNHKQIKQDCEEYRKKMRIKTPTLEEQIMKLSGGNQQKVLVARWLLTDPEILILDEPTRGIDVGAKYEIHTLITNLAAHGKAIILISSELPEILGMCDRIIVMHEGRLTGTVNRTEATQELIMKYATQ